MSHLAMSTSPRRAGLYRLFSEAGDLLYVGVGYDPAVRIAFHRRFKQWGPEIAREEVQWFACRNEAEAAELAAIRDERPIHNVVTGDDAGRARYLPRSGGLQWGRPVTELSERQEGILATLAAMAAEAADIEAQTKLLVAQAHDRRVPISVIADAAGTTRKTVYRHLGRKMS